MTDYHTYTLAQYLEDEYQAELAQQREEIDPDEWDAFCEDVVLAHAGSRQYEDQTWLYRRKDV